MNRFEHLVGHMYRQLVADTRRIMSRSSEEEIIASVLLFKSYNESFYYVGTYVNPLISPGEVNAALITELRSAKLIKTAPKLFWYLGAYFCSSVGAHQINTVFNLNDELADANASTFNITYTNYKELKETWRRWLQDNAKSFKDAEVEEGATFEILTYQSFLLANFLLTLMPIPVSESSHNSSSAIYKVLTEKNIPEGVALGWIDPASGNFKVDPKRPYRWKYVETSELTYGQLLDLVEFILIQPVDVKDKENILKGLYEEYLRTGDVPGELVLPEYEMTALAKPFIYNSEFRGIMYVARMFRDRGFDEDDAVKFNNIINMLQVGERLYEAGFALTQMAVLRKDANDWNDPSLLRILNLMHFFTSASAGIVFFENEEGQPVAYERFKVGEAMETLSRIDADSIKDTVESTFQAKPFETGALWFSDMDREGKKLLSLPSNGERSSNSVLVMSFSLPHQGQGYLILYYKFKFRRLLLDRAEGRAFGEEFSTFVNEVGWEFYGKVFSKRLHGSIERLIDADSEHKKTITFERERSIYFIQGLSLLTIHDFRNKFEPLIVTPLKEIARGLNCDKNVKDHINAIAKYTERFLQQSGRYATAFRNFFDLKMNDPERLLEEPWRIMPRIFTDVCNELRSLYSSVDEGARNMRPETHNSREVLIGVNREILEFLLEQLIANAIEADKENGIKERQYIISWKGLSSRKNNSSTSVQISVWNAGNHIPDYIRMSAGKGVRKNPREGHTGLGFYFLEYALSQLGAREGEYERHFKIDNTFEPRGVEVSFILPAITDNAIME